MKKHEIGLSCTPSKHIGGSTDKVEKYTVTYGGGMGGSVRYIYAKKVTPVDDSFIELKDLDGTVTTVNKKYVATIDEKKIVTCITDITAYKNHGKKTCKKAIQTRRFIIDKSDSYTMVNKYMGFDDGPTQLDSDTKIT